MTTYSTYSASALKDYITCPKMFYLKRRERLPPDFRPLKMVAGGAFHKTIEALNTEDFGKADPAEWAEERFRKELIKTINDPEQPKVVYTQKDLTDVIKSRLRMMAGYLDQFFDKHLMYAAEAYFKMTIKGIQVQGYIDAILFEDEMFKLVEFKTNARAPSDAFLTNDYQLNMYALAMREGRFYPNAKWVDGKMELGDDPGIVLGVVPEDIEFYWYHLADNVPYFRDCKGGKKGELRGKAWYRVHKTEEELEEFQFEVANIVKGINTGIFFKSPSDDFPGCGTCNYLYTCTGHGVV